MARKLLFLFAATTALTATSQAFAQAADAEGVDNGGGDIIVTARRESENIQDVPVSVKVVTGDTIQKLSITDASELSKVAPGLNLVNNGPSTLVVLRGVAWKPGSGTPATPIYLNEIPFDPQQVVQSVFDIGQIEVLRGPQGTTRGAPSISGAVTITTRRPDLEDIGGYVQGMYGTANHWDVQGAINVPVIRDVLAIRAAANIEDSEADRVHSIYSSVKPKLRSRTYRISALFKPTDTLTFEAMYQRRRQLTRTYAQVVGTGSPGAAAAGIPANFNGPALTVADRKSVQESPSGLLNNTDLLTTHASWDILGQQFNYNYGRQFDQGPTMFSAQDPGNYLPGYTPFQTQGRAGRPHFHTQEVRLSSIREEGRFFDYDIGFFQKHSSGTILVSSPVFLSGAFGAPGTPPGAVTTPNPRYILTPNTSIALGQVYDSFYGNLQFHLGNNTELSGGLRRIRDRVPVDLNVTTSAASTVATALANLRGAPCSAAGLVNSVYPGFCDANVPAGSGNLVETHNDLYHATIYNFSLSHKFSDEVLAYVTTGSSYRSGLPAIANSGLPAGFLVPAPERAKSYELGVKTSWGRSVRLNAAVFQIDYDNQLTTFQGINYYNSVRNAVSQTSLAFYRNVDSRLRGFELEMAAEPIDNLSLSANVSYSQIKSQGGTVPCNDATRPITATNRINLCPSVKGQVLSQTAPFQAALNGSYQLPLASSVEGYVRFNLNYQGNNPNYGNAVKTPAYAILDLFAGVSGGDGAWDLGLYAKNIFDRQVELNRATILSNLYPNYASAPPGYYSASVSSPREIGVTLRYAFGSR
ncbi:TonB-dependent receptor plug domain-containing protein [Novosphingobium sp. G106]|uniref:TonB-dependent receptor n=1 Tax=Novosphingobium sp. G106 TaxID=2849500 RepID=UPI001C2DC988|nr:TonB-dependent receptor plug domain-containing protein [Novosphingobium sp. G106]MBV1686239.1 TonB-dependent receptor plug domain-containing protein [Novosphingobium sp. G106]